MSDLVEPGVKSSAMLKAFAVTEECENTGGIVFARHAVTARRLGASEYNGGEFEGVSCRRAPWADEWADKQEDVPVQLMIAHGWHFECCGCGHRIDEDYLHENDLLIADVIGTQRSSVFCNEICKAEEALRDAIKRDREKRMLAIMRERVLKRFPGVEFATEGNWAQHAYAEKRNGSWQVSQAVVSFKFPGMVHGPATYRFDLDYHKVGPVRPHVSCCNGDRDAFEAWAASVPTPAVTPGYRDGQNDR